MESKKPTPLRYVTHAGKLKHRVIFLHGLGGSPQSLVAHELAGAFQRRGDRLEMLVPWLRPVHRDLSDAGPHTMTDQLKRIKAEINRAPGKVVLLGHSFGAKAAFKLAKECPDKVSCVVGVAPSISMLYSYWKQLTGERGLPRELSVINRRLEQHRVHLHQLRATAEGKGHKGRVADLDGHLGYLDVMKDLAGHDEPTLEGPVGGPTLIIHGEKDQSVSVHYVRRFAERSKKSQLRMLEMPKADHHFQVVQGRHLDQQATAQVIDQMAKAISEFMDAHDLN
ncbi:MAG: alpha/beta hydrolase [Deltaproteobacteria bacterium]|nr:alpha/beta hydrolase [Deltaproteobacteria bacterium]